MSSPRTPRFKPPANVETTEASQRANLNWILSRLRKAELTDGAMHALATAYEAFNAGDGLIRQVERAAAERPQLLRKAIRDSEHTHVLLHKIFGAQPPRIDLRRDNPRERSVSRPGARSKQLEFVATDPCDLTRPDTCSNQFFPQLRKHAEFCRFLRESLEYAEAATKQPSAIRANINSIPMLRSKGEDAHFLCEEIGASTSVATLFILAYKYDPVELPISKKDLEREAHRLSEALSSWSQRQKKAKRAK